MVRVFEVRPNVEEDPFQHFLIDGDDSVSWPIFDLMSWPNPVTDWPPVRLYADRPTLPRPDFVHLWGASSPVVSTTLPDEIRQILPISGELLPVDVEGERLEWFHVTKVLNVVDRDATTWEPHGVGNPLAFHMHRPSQVPVFRVPENNASTVYCVQGHGEFDFKAIVEQHELTGLAFREAWNSDVGGIRRESRW